MSRTRNFRAKSKNGDAREEEGVAVRCNIRSEREEKPRTYLARLICRYLVKVAAAPGRRRAPAADAPGTREEEVSGAIWFRPSGPVKKRDDIREEEDAAAKFRFPREEEET